MLWWKDTGIIWAHKKATLLRLCSGFVGDPDDAGCFPGGSDGKEPACNAGDPGSIPGSGRFPGKGNGNPLQYSFLENPKDRGAWWGCKKSDMTEKLTHTHTHTDAELSNHMQVLQYIYLCISNDKYSN